jgi:hypothetical protein
MWRRSREGSLVGGGEAGRGCSLPHRRSPLHHRRKSSHHATVVGAPLAHAMGGRQATMRGAKCAAMGGAECTTVGEGRAIVGGGHARLEEDEEGWQRLEEERKESVASGRGNRG